LLDVAQLMIFDGWGEREIKTTSPKKAVSEGLCASASFDLCVFFLRGKAKIS
jgi:hypothetical protein